MTRTTNNTLVFVEVDGTTTEIENSYTGIKGALQDRPFDFVHGGRRFGAYIDDEGMLLELPMNVPVSMVLQRPIYGPAVCTKGDTDDEGDTLPMDDDMRELLHTWCGIWHNVVRNAADVGQDPYAYANESTIPPPEIIGFDSAEEMEAYLEGRAQ